jgi:hypothetical protein
MTTSTHQEPDARTDASWLRLTRLGIVLAVIGLLMLGPTMLFATTTSEGDFQHGWDYVLTAAALPHGIGLFLVVLGFHRLQHGRDGRLGTAAVWLYGICVTELVIQCAASLAVGSELRWGPLYPLCALGLMVALALLAAGSWSTGLLPRWMLAVWPPLGLVGSFLGIGPIPLVFAVFLVAMAVLLASRVHESETRRIRPI